MKKINEIFTATIRLFALFLTWNFYKAIFKILIIIIGKIIQLPFAILAQGFLFLNWLAYKEEKARLSNQIGIKQGFQARLFFLKDKANNFKEFKQLLKE